MREETQARSRDWHGAGMIDTRLAIAQRAGLAPLIIYHHCLHTKRQIPKHQKSVTWSIGTPRCSQVLDKDTLHRLRLPWPRLPRLPLWTRMGPRAPIVGSMTAPLGVAVLSMLLRSPRPIVGLPRHASSFPMGGTFAVSVWVLHSRRSPCPGCQQVSEAVLAQNIRCCPIAGLAYIEIPRAILHSVTGAKGTCGQQNLHVFLSALPSSSEQGVGSDTEVIWGSPSPAPNGGSHCVQIRCSTVFNGCSTPLFETTAARLAFNPCPTAVQPLRSPVPLLLAQCSSHCVCP